MLRAINRRTEELAQDFAVAVSEARGIARELGRDQLSQEFAVGGFETQLPRVPESPANSFEIQRATSSFRSVWASAAFFQLMSWKNAKESTARLPQRMRSTARRTKKHLERHAVWQSAEAYNREHTETLETALVEGEQLLPLGWRERVYRVWSAVLDHKTCPICHGLDGTMVPKGKPFPDGLLPPVHGHCRCIELLVIVPEEQLAKLPGSRIDYQELKADVRDYFRGTRLTALRGRRHAGDYIQDVLETTSPQALSRRLQNRDYLQ